MSRRIDRNVMGPGGFITRSDGLAAKGADRDRAAGNKKSPSVRKKANDRDRTSLAVKVRRKWDSTKYRLLGRFDIYRRLHEVPLGLYVDVYV